MPEYVSRSINELSSESLPPPAPHAGQNQSPSQSFQEDYIDQNAIVDTEQHKFARVEGEINTSDPYAINQGNAIVEVKSLNTEKLSARSNQLFYVPGRNGNPDAEAQSLEPKIEDKASKPQPTFKSAFVEKHQILAMIFVKHGLVSRAERLTIVLVLLMCELFAIGVFYDSDRNPDEEETEDDKTVEQSAEGMGWRDFWIAIYSMAIVIPIPIILNKLFTRKELDPEADDEETSKLKRKMKTKRVIGYIISYLACAWCTWSIIMLSVEFGKNTSQIWLINFAITTVSDIVIKDVCVAALTVFLVLYRPILKEKCKKRKNEYQISPIDSDRTSKIPQDTNK